MKNPNVEPKYVKPLKKICMTIGQLPSSYLETMSYYEMLVWFVEFLKNQIIPALDNNAEAVRELQQLYVELKDYVDNYFGQNFPELVENKLNEMAEDGTLENLLNDSAHLTKSYDTYTNMIADSATFTNGLRLKTNGYYSIGDGGETEYYVTNSPNSNRYQIDLNNGLYLTLNPINNYIGVRMFGCYGDAIHDDYEAFQTAVNNVQKYNTNILHVEKGKYLLEDTIVIPSNLRILGSNKTMYQNDFETSILIRNNNYKLLSLKGDDFDVPDGKRVSDVEIDNITFLTDGNATYFDEPYIYTERCLYSHFNNLIFRNNSKAFYFGKATFDCRINNCDFVTCGIETETSVTDEYHDDTYYGINQIMFYGCRFEGTYETDVIKLGGRTRELFFFGLKFEGNLLENKYFLNCSNEKTNADICMYGTRITTLPSNLGGLFNLVNTSRCIFNINHVDNSSASINRTPYITIDGTSSIYLTYILSANISSYNPSYYINNLNTNNNFNIESNINTQSYYLTKQLYSSPKLMNKNFIATNTFATQSSDSAGVLMNIQKENETPFEMGIKTGWYNFTNNQPILNVIDDVGIGLQLRNRTLMCQKGFRLPYLSEQWISGITNGDLYIDNYTGDIPGLKIGIGGSSRKIHWNNSVPTTGYHARGEIVLNTEPSSGTNVGWICTSSGNPGTWRTFGSIGN